MDITNSKTLWALLAATILITLSFPYAANIWDLAYLDALSGESEIRNLLASLNAEQKTAHIWITLTLDVAYPLAYGSFFAGTALAFFSDKGKILAIPAFATIAIDIFEGILQVLLLSDTADVVGIKTIVTPLKFGGFYIAALIALFAWIRWLFRKVRGTS